MENKGSIFLKPIEDLNLTVRTTNCLLSGGIVLVEDMVLRSESDLFQIPNFGRRALIEVKEVLAKFKLSLGMTEEEVGDYWGEGRAQALEQIEEDRRLAEEERRKKDEEAEIRRKEAEARKLARLCYVPQKYLVFVREPIYRLSKICPSTNGTGLCAESAFQNAVVFPKGQYWVFYDPGKSGKTSRITIPKSVYQRLHTSHGRYEDGDVNMNPFKKDPKGFFEGLDIKVIAHADW